MSKLNQDILLMIFEELHDDSKSLFSFLMVNKLWCETVIPILWRNPWSYENINYSNKISLFSIIAHYLFDSIKQFITNPELKLPLNSNLLFDYLSFCRSINVDNIRILISIGSSLPHNRFFMEEEFYYLLMKKCPDLKYLDMEVIKHQIFYFPEAKARFESLCKLICYTSIDSSYFYGLSRCCQNIQTLIVTNVNPNLNNGIVKLIEVQKNLNHIEWKDDFYDAHFTIDDDPYKNLLLTLEKKAENLSYLKIFFHYLENYEHYLFQMILPRFYKLKTLAIGGYLFFTQDQLNQLKMTVFNKLEMIRIDYNEFNRLDFISSIIENSGENLKKIVFRPNDIDHELYKYNEYSLNFIRKIYENCPSIEYLSIMLSPSKQHLAEFENLLKKCQNLKSLLLVIYNTDRAESYEKIFKNGEILLKILIRSAPPNFKEIRFYDEFKFSLESLEDFLRAWKGRPALSIITSDSIYEGINYKVLINKYKSYGVIKDFEYILFEDDIDYDF